MTPEIEESETLLLAIKLAKRYEFDNIIPESHSQVRVTRLSRAVIYMSEFDNVLEDILLFSASFNSICEKRWELRSSSSC